MPLDKKRKPYSCYRLVTCRVPKWYRKRFRLVLNALKEYSLAAGYLDDAEMYKRLVKGETRSCAQKASARL